jgi:hypothetical protein
MIWPVAASGARGDEHIVLNRKIQSPKQIYTHTCNAKADTFQTLRRDSLISIPFVLAIDLLQAQPLGASPFLIDPLLPDATDRFRARKYWPSLKVALLPFCDPVSTPYFRSYHISRLQKLRQNVVLAWGILPHAPSFEQMLIASMQELPRLSYSHAIALTTHGFAASGTIQRPGTEI